MSLGPPQGAGGGGSLGSDIATAELQDGAVTLAKMADLAQDKFIVRTTASTGVPEVATVTAAARTVLDDATVAAMVDTLGGVAAQGSGAIVRATSPALTTPNIGTPSAGTLTSCSGLPVSGIVASTSTALGVGSVELGHASDTTIARSAAGKVSVEAKAVPLMAGAVDAVLAGPTVARTYTFPDADATVLSAVTGVAAITSTDNAVARYDGTAGQVQNSVVTIADTTGVMNLNNAGAELQINGTKVVDSQQAAIADASAIGSLVGADMVSMGNINNELGALKDKINAVLAMLRVHGLIAT